MLDNKIFEQEGLKIDKERVLTYSQLSCPLECKYCFVNDLNFNQSKNVAYLSEKQFELMEQLPPEIKLVMLGCDTEFFQSKKDSLKILERISDLKKDISVITKLDLNKDFLSQLRLIDLRMREQGNILVFSETISCLDSYKKWEPKTPNPRKRIETIIDAKSTGLKTMVAIRPLLPDLPDSELKEIVDKTIDHCDGYYSGPLYLKNLDPELIDVNNKNLEIEEEHQPHWMPEGNIFYKVTNRGQMDRLKSIIESKGGVLLDGAAEGISHIKQNEKY